MRYAQPRFWILITLSLILALVLPAARPKGAAAHDLTSRRPMLAYGDSCDDNEEDSRHGNNDPTGRIVLHTQPGAWTVVQWQGGTGHWHDVEGWRGQAQNGTIVWTVEEKDFGSGPFRWVVYQPQMGRIIDASYPFYLPHAGETVTIDMVARWLPAPEPWRHPRAPHPNRWHPDRRPPQRWRPR